MLASMVEGVAQVEHHRGRDAGPDTVDLLIEVPHGATRTADYEALRVQLQSELPDGLVDFFCVNTDVGAPELATAVARAFVEREPTRGVVVVRSLIPRTFIDCNRRIDAAPEAFREGRVTPGLMPWITAPSDNALLRELHAHYLRVVGGASARLRRDGAVLLLHTYAPREVDVQVDAHIVANLRRAYAPEVEPTWPLRPEVDVIGRGVDGTDHLPQGVVDELRRQLAGVGVEVGAGATYPLHPSTLAWDHVEARPGRVLCLEVRRDLLADPFEPFAQMNIAQRCVERLAGPIATALRHWWTAGPTREPA
jgi:predicted N-formylglutamate amidohydrolase